METQNTENVGYDKEIAKTILEQLSAGKPGQLIAMIGAKYFTYDKEGTLVFKFMRGNQSINGIKIRLNSMDLYDMDFFNIRGRIVETRSGVYNDQLKDIFESVTGLNVTLGSMGRRA